MMSLTLELEGPPRSLQFLTEGLVRRLQCKDIEDEVFLEAVRRAPAHVASGWRNSWEVHEALEVLMNQEIPYNLLMAKARKMESKGLIGGCTCGCRGDWHPSDECLDRIYCCPLMS